MSKSTDRLAFTLIAAVAIAIALGWWWLILLFFGAGILVAIFERGT